MTLWDKLQFLNEQIDFLTPYEQEFVENLFQNLDPNDVYEELTERQAEFLEELYLKYQEIDE